jgi:hypothetical protein
MGMLTTLSGGRSEFSRRWNAHILKYRLTDQPGGRSLKLLSLVRILLSKAWGIIAILES